MGTIQSKIKDGYCISQKPVLKKKSQRAVRPLQDLSSENSLKTNHKKFSNDETRTNRPKMSFYSSNGELSGQDTITESCSNYHGFPSSAIGVIQSRIDGLPKYSIGGLIASNIVLTAARNIYSLKNRKVCPQIKFILNHELGREEFDAERAYIPENFKSKSFTEKEYRENIFMQDYAVIVLNSHVDIQLYGTLGFDFNQSTAENSAEVITYKLVPHMDWYRIEPSNCIARLEENQIRFNSYTTSENAGGPVLCLKDSSFVMIGIENSALEKKKINEQRGLRLNEQMYNQICAWITQQEQEIDLRDKNLGKQGIKKLIKLRWISLASINISRNNIGQEGLKYFTKCEWNNLHHFDIGGNDITKEGVSYLVKIPMKNLMSLNMWGNSIGSEGAQTLLQGNWKHLANINLYNNNISNDGIKNLINASWQQLQSLNLGKNNINNNVLPSFRYSVWRDLVSLNLWGNSIKNEKTILVQLNKYFHKIKFLYL